MSATFILIAVLTYNVGQPSQREVPLTAEFSSKEKCEAAGAAMEKQWTYKEGVTLNTALDYICVEK